VDYYGDMILGWTGLNRMQ